MLALRRLRRKFHRFDVQYGPSFVPPNLPTKLVVAIRALSADITFDCSAGRISWLEMKASRFEELGFETGLANSGEPFSVIRTRCGLLVSATMFAKILRVLTEKEFGHIDKLGVTQQLVLDPRETTVDGFTQD